VQPLAITEASAATPFHILYSFRRCPYAMRARMALLASEVHVHIREITLRAKPEEMIAASPKGTVPVLALADGTVIDESIDIMRWALRQNDPKGWLAGDDRDLIEANDGPFKHHLDRYKYPHRYGGDPLPHRDAALSILMGLDRRLATQANLCGEEPMLTDFALCPFIRQFAGVDAAWFTAQPLPQIQRWLDRHLTSDLFRAIMIKLSAWHPEDAPIAFTTSTSEALA
jgi:glutathione S-transferase